jgi:peptide/nickel transport system substrate-binding protein
MQRSFRLSGHRRRASAGALSASAIVALALGLSACGSSTSQSASGAGSSSQKGGTLTIYDSDSTFAADPAKSWSLAITSMGLLDRRLTTWKVSSNGVTKVVPDLATTTGTPSDDGQVWTYHLKSGIYFSNGKPITSQDVKYGIERTYAPALSGGLNYQKGLIAGTNGYNGPFNGKQLSSIQTPDAKTIVFHLTKPYGDWPWVVSTTSMAPVPDGDAPAATFGNHPVTSGPYAVQSYTTGRSLVLVRNKYWRQSSDPNRSAGPSRIDFVLNEDPTVEAQTLIADGTAASDAFGADFVPPAQLAQIENNPSVKARLVTSSASPLEYLAVNLRSTKLHSSKLRDALEYAINRKSVVVASGGTIAATPATTLITPGIAGRVDYNLYPASNTGNLTKAKQLLDQAGIHNLTLTLATENDPVSLAISEAVQQSYKAVGINVVLKPLSTDAWTSLVTGNSASGYDLALTSWQPDFPSAMDNIEPLFDSSMIGNGNFNVSRLDDPAVDKLISKAQGTINPTAANALWAQADRAIVATGAVVPLVYNRNSFLRGSNVQNFYIGEFPAYPVYTAVSLAQ